jgi:hypothetical protein
VEFTLIGPMNSISTEGLIRILATIELLGGKFTTRLEAGTRSCVILLRMHNLDQMAGLHARFFYFLKRLKIAVMTYGLEAWQFLVQAAPQSVEKTLLLSGASQAKRDFKITALLLQFWTPPQSMVDGSGTLLAREID